MGEYNNQGGIKYKLSQENEKKVGGGHITNRYLLFFFLCNYTTRTKGYSQSFWGYGKEKGEGNACGYKYMSQGWKEREERRGFLVQTR